MADLISIIVPIYRVEAYLEQCIWSIRNQTYKNLEIILVDDGSDDRCPQICDRHARDDKRIKVIHKVNGGLDSARKAGMLAATGKYVGYVDSDDWIEPEMYEMLLTYMHEYKVEIVESGVIDSYIDGGKKRTPYLEEGCYKDEDFIEKVEPRILYAGAFWSFGISPYLWSKLFLKNRVEKYQMKEDLTNIIHNDTMVSLPCIAESKKVYITHDCYYHYRVRSDSLKRKCRTNEAEKLLKCYSEILSRFKGTRLCTESDAQLKYYMMYWLLYRSISVFDRLDEGKYLIPFGGLNIKSRIVIYGAGAVGMHLENYIQSIKESNIVCWIDRNYIDLQRTLDVKCPKEIVNYEYDYVIIAILKEDAVRSARQELVNLGVAQNKILWIAQKYIDDPGLLLDPVLREKSV